MFEVGFQELALIFGVALVVLGPTRLPGLVSKIGRWVGKARSMAREFRSQLESEINLEELNKMTDMRPRDPSPPAASTPAIPPEFSGQPPDPALTNYPYGAPDAPAATDDTYSHAHAAGDAPMPHEQEGTEPAAVQPAAEPPAVADASPADAAHTAAEDTSFHEPSLDDLPPDDARRNA
jgi:sec-independent protein translocase protein TatB